MSPQPVAKAFRVVHDAFKIRPTYATLAAAEQAIDYVLTEAARRRRRLPAKLTPGQQQGSEVFAAVKYRNRMVQRVDNDADGTKRYRVQGMEGRFLSFDAAQARIDWTVKSLERRKRHEAWDDEPMKRDSEK